MACTFSAVNEYGPFLTVDLEELGTVGEPDIQYANFVTETASPSGYDGSVLANFKRDQTVIRFNLALTGTESERVNKINELVRVMSHGMGRLKMPGMTIGYYFEAVPNMALQPARYIDGFVLPLEFVVPPGCAVCDRAASIDAVLPSQGGTEVMIGGFLHPQWEFEADVQIQAAAIQRLSVGNTDSSWYMVADRWSPTVSGSGTAHIVLSSEDESVESPEWLGLYVSTMTLGGMDLGLQSVSAVYRSGSSDEDTAVEGVLRWKERGVW